MKALATIYRHEVCNGNSSNLQATLSEKKNNMCGVLPIMKFMLLFTIAFMFHVSLAQEGEVASLSQNNLQTNIVYVHKPEGLHSMQSESLHRWYQSLLPVTTASTENQQEQQWLLYSYRHVVTGFAARLTAEEVKAMEKKEEVLSIHNEMKFFLQTTRSPGFLGLHPEKGFWKESNFGKGVIIGVMDTCRLPDHPSFWDEGLPPPPDRWEGRCDFNQTANRTFVCNNKIIGARSFQVYDNLLQTSSAQPVDEIRHGTHTASTAAGNFVRGANLYNNANGTASGVAPHAHLAIYQVCSLDECSSTDVLAGFDAAVEDGVNVIFISMTSLNFSQLFEDSIALAAFSAIRR
ncbi:subtilisin-like protease SBT1.4 [Prunus yedoensis var. nudiflora]|uniref:Subtilisin-like protease SBT1.4 n=1 Tax=Prunus yedoensis var. nudiflora TaxID=2094558 RepID=A0A314YS42_PRUYE|nr:subtilisin-like protease SBT1.4 [Prunus yedoensis var. nudiflora]